AADLNAEAIDGLATCLRFAPRIDDEIGAEVAQADERDIAANAIGEVEAGKLAVLCDQGDSRGDRLLGGGERDGLAEQLHFAFARAIKSEQAVEDLASARAHQAVDAKNLALADGERDVVDLARRGESGDRQAL